MLMHASQQPVAFDITDPKFARAYFDILHHPKEEKGVDFWWLDWQQGTRSRAANLDPLWWLNHLHFYDLGRDGKKRPFIFSRWGGLGNHRYPIGFSGDSVVSWESLAFQPYFTSTAANVGYGWWSHDIGGHMGGQEDGELFTRWMQFGVFSPILRLHSTYNAYQDRRPWAFDSEVLRITRGAMQLRHALIPYLYSMAWRTTQQAISLVIPMYYAYPEADEAYRCPDQYFFGSELLVAPYLTPKNPETRLSRGSVWLPGTKETQWFNFFNGERQEGGKWVALFGELDDIPVFAKAGAIVPLGPRVAWGGVDHPAELNLILFPGADNRFELIEDDGSANPTGDEHVCRTVFEQRWQENELQLTVNPVQGNPAIVPAERTYDLLWRGIREPEQVELQIGEKMLQAQWEYDPANETLRMVNLPLPCLESMKVRLAVKEGSLISGRDRLVENIRRLLHAFNIDPNLKSQIEAELPAIKADPTLLARYQRRLTEAQIGVLWQVFHP
jgi:alpha-glucosidase (family GH31 glycosyl hydrolase)